MMRSGLPTPEIPALAVIALVLWCAPVAADLLARWQWEVPVRMGASELVRGGSL